MRDDAAHRLYEYMTIIDRVKLMFVRGGSPDEKRPDDITSKQPPKHGETCSVTSKCCSAPSAEKKESCCAEGECDCS